MDIYFLFCRFLYVVGIIHNGGYIMRRIDKVSVMLYTFAAVFCYDGSILSAPLFITASSIGLYDSTDKKNLTGVLINLIFLALNLATLLKYLWS